MVYVFFSRHYSNHTDETKDNTHLRYEGAVNFAGLIAKGLKSLGGIYGQIIMDELSF